jgi:hypothetical protein
MLNRSPLISPGFETLTASHAWPAASQSGAFPRFGGPVITQAASKLTKDIDPLTLGAHKLYELIAGDPGRRIIFMDLVGWCGLRTVIDYNRELFYFKDRSANPDDKPKGNIPAAVERVQREITATLSDVAVAGPVVANLTNFSDSLRKEFAGNFIDQNFMTYLGQTARSLAKEVGQNKPLDAEALLKALYQRIGQDMAKGQPPAVQAQLKTWFNPQTFQQYLTPETNAVVKGLKFMFGGTKTKFNVREAENHLAKLMNLVGDHSIDVAQQKNMTGLLGNMHKFQDKMISHFDKSPVTFIDLAKKLENSVKTRVKLPLILGGIFLINLVMPHIIQRNTQKAFGMSSYPGETGLILPDDNTKANLNYAAQTTEQKNHLFPFLSRSLNNGNWLPLLGVAVMLPAALGIYRSGRLFSGGKLNLHEGFDLPKGFSLKQLREYGKSWLKAHDFETSLPWAGEQQQATTYANTLVARIATARSPIEFRERLIDSVLSYVAAFEMNGAIDNKIARSLSQGKGWMGKQAQKLMGVTQADLIKKNGDIRTLNEIYSIADDKTRRDTLTVKTWQGWAATLFTTLTMGVFEPILSIFLTSKQADLINAHNNRKHYEKTTQAYGNPRLSDQGPAFSAFYSQQA